MEDLLGWWKLDGDGTDATVGGHDLTNVDNRAVPVQGRSGMAMKFDGTACMTAPIWPEARLQGVSGLTLMAWIKADVYPCTQQYDMNAVAGRGWDYSIGAWCYQDVPSWYGQGVAGIVRPENPQGWGYGGGYGAGTEWRLVTMTWDHQYAVTWLDGKPIAGLPIAAANITDYDPLFAVGCMASWYWSGNDLIHHFHGAIDEVMLYRRVLTDEEIRSYFVSANPCVETQQPLADNTPCFDDNYCTQTDTCQAGVCVGSNPKVCTALDACHDPGVCQTWWGQCTNPVKPDGVACNDGQSCTPTDTCQAGTCVGATPITCTSAMQECGVIGDGCGGTLNCGSCTSSSHCNLSGQCIPDPSVAGVPTGVNICRILLEALTIFSPIPKCHSCGWECLIPPFDVCAAPTACLAVPHCSFLEFIDLLEETISADSFYCSADMSAEDFFKHLVAGRIQNLSAVTVSGGAAIDKLYTTYLDILTAKGRNIPANAQDIIKALVSQGGSNGVSFEDIENVKIVSSDLPTADFFLVGDTHAITLGPVIVVRADLYNIIFDPANTGFTTNALLNMPAFKMVPPDPINCCNANLNSSSCPAGTPSSCLNSQYRDMIDMLIHELAHVHQYWVWGREGFLLSYLFSTVHYQAVNTLSTNQVDGGVPDGGVPAPLNEFERQACLYGAGIAQLTGGTYCSAAKPFHDFTADLYGFPDITCM